MTLPIKSREIILRLILPGTPTTSVEYKLLGLNSVNYAFDNAVGVTQGLAKNFIHPWFLKNFTIKLSGSSYVGTYKNTIDAIVDSKVPPTGDMTDKSQQEAMTKTTATQKAADKRNALIVASDTTKKYFNKAAQTMLGTAAKVPNPAQGQYYRTEQLLNVMKNINDISEAIRTGVTGILDNAAITDQNMTQQLIIKNYYNTDSDATTMTFVGFISNFDVTEKSNFLGKLDYDLTFTGILTPVAATQSGKSTGKTALEQVGVKSSTPGTGASIDTTSTTTAAIADQSQQKTSAATAPFTLVPALDKLPYASAISYKNGYLINATVLDSGQIGDLTEDNPELISAN